MVRGGVHDAAGADGVADALVDAVLERDVDVGLEGLQTALADHADDVVAVGDGAAAVEGGFDAGRQLVGVDVALAELGDHVEVAAGDVGEGEDGVLQLGDGEKVAHQAAGEADGTGSDHGDFNGHREAPGDDFVVGLD